MVLILLYHIVSIIFRMRLLFIKVTTQPLLLAAEGLSSYALNTMKRPTSGVTPTPGCYTIWHNSLHVQAMTDESLPRPNDLGAEQQFYQHF